jgi:TolB-like protein/tRNA A-37 threonylcarbamoyl transferase component Bud32
VRRTFDDLSRALAERYIIEKEIGAGGMATVYLASDPRHGRKVAVKVLHSELSSALAAERFHREIRLVAQFNHPHILSLYDSGEASGFLYYVMPFVEGETLRARLERDGRLSLADTVRILREVADALAYAHARSVVHRDIKPANVLLSGRHAVVADFGIAKALSSAGADKLTTVGMAVGTPQYIAPEQAMGEAGVDARSDIYSVGLLGYEMLAGRPTFDGPTAQAILAAQVMSHPPDISVVRPDTPAQLAAVIERCLRKAPEERWASADDLLAELDRIEVTPSAGVAPTGARAAVAPVLARIIGPRRSRQAPWIIGVVAVIAAIVVATLINSRTAKAGGRIETIGVMPIEDISGSDSVFAASMHDALTIALSRPRNVGVAPRSAMMRYRGTSLTTRDIARQNHLDAIVEATVFRAGDVVRINVQFTNPMTTRALWSETYERNARNVLATQDEVAGMIASAVGAAIREPAR